MQCIQYKTLVYNGIQQDAHILTIYYRLVYTMQVKMKKKLNILNNVFLARFLHNFVWCQLQMPNQASSFKLTEQHRTQMKRKIKWKRHNNNKCKKEKKKRLKNQIKFINIIQNWCTTHISNIWNRMQKSSKARQVHRRGIRIGIKIIRLRFVRIGIRILNVLLFCVEWQARDCTIVRQNEEQNLVSLPHDNNWFYALRSLLLRMANAFDLSNSSSCRPKHIDLNANIFRTLRTPLDCTAFCLYHKTT